MIDVTNPAQVSQAVVECWNMLAHDKTQGLPVAIVLNKGYARSLQRPRRHIAMLTTLCSVCVLLPAMWGPQLGSTSCAACCALMIWWRRPGGS